jgi:hypothetical protein
VAYGEQQCACGHREQVATAETCSSIRGHVVVWHRVDHQP